jgi:hypothetical protein
MAFIDILTRKNVNIESLSGEIIDLKDYFQISKLIFNTEIIYDVSINLTHGMPEYRLYHSELFRLDIIPDNSTIQAIIENRIGFKSYQRKKSNIVRLSSYPEIAKYQDLFYYELSKFRINTNKYPIINHYNTIIDLCDENILIIIQLISIVPDKVINTIKNNINNKLIYKEYNLLLGLMDENNKIDLEDQNQLQNINKDEYKILQFYKLNSVISEKYPVRILENKNDENLIHIAVTFNNRIYQQLSNKYKTRDITALAAGLDPYIIEYAPKYLLEDNDIMNRAIDTNSDILTLITEKYFYNNKNKIIESMYINKIGLEIFPEFARRDKDLVLKAVEYKCTNLRYASTELRNDFQVVMKAVENNGNSLEYADINLRNNKVIFLRAVNNKTTALLYASENILNDKETMLDAIKINGNILSLINSQFRDDRKFVLEAVKSQGKSLEYALHPFRQDKEIVLQAVSNYGESLRFASIALRDDRQVVLQAVKNDGLALEYASIRNRNDRDIVLAAIKNNGSAIEFMNKILAGDKNIVLKAVENNGLALKFVAKEHDIIIQSSLCLKYKIYDFEYLSADEEIVLAAVKNNGLALEYASEELKDNRIVVLEAVKQNNRALKYGSIRCKNDKEILKATKGDIKYYEKK